MLETIIRLILWIGWLVAICGSTYLLYKGIDKLLFILFKYDPDKAQDIPDREFVQGMQYYKPNIVEYGSTKHKIINNLMLVIPFIWFIYWWSDYGRLLIDLKIIDKQYWRENFCGFDCYDALEDRWHDGNYDFDDE